MSEKYTIEVGRRATFTEEVEMLRTHSADTPEAVEIMIEALRDSYEQRDGVAWESEEPDESGYLSGRSAVHDAIYTIRVTPPLEMAS